MSRFQIIKLTNDAIGRIKEIMNAHPEASGLMIGVKKGGCAGMEYTIDLATGTPENADRVDQDGVSVFVSKSATLFLLGTEMGFETSKLRTGFVFNNPNQTSACGCGESVEIIPVSQKALNELQGQQ